MSESLLSKCVALLQRDDIKQEIKQVLSPTINEVLVQIYPYIYLSLIFVILSFLLHLGIFVLLWRNKSILHKE
jgi:hypothetical protein